MRPLKKMDVSTESIQIPRAPLSPWLRLAHVWRQREAAREAFRRATGSNPRVALEERRIEQAALALLETDRRVWEIARAAGYDDPYHFSRVFKRVVGFSPRAYRQRARSGS